MHLCESEGIRHFVALIDLECTEMDVAPLPGKKIENNQTLHLSISFFYVLVHWQTLATLK